MHDDPHDYQRLAFGVCAALALGGSLATTGCGAAQDDTVFATRASRSSTIALAEDAEHVAMVNPEAGTLSVFATADNAVVQVATGGEPASVVIAPDGKRAYVANRADGTVVRIDAIDGPAPAAGATVEVGSEPVGLALSPSGRRLFVAELAESRVAVVDTSTMKVVSSIAVDRPRGLLVTNNNTADHPDTSDDDETLVVTQFFGTPVAGREGKDDGRIGHVRTFSLGSLAETHDIALGALDSGFAKNGDPAQGTVTTSANQLAAVAATGSRIYVTSVSASPEAPTRFDNNVFPVVYVADLETGTEIRDGGGTTNLARKIYDAIPSPSAQSPRFIPGDLSDLAFLGDSNVAYAVGRAGDVMVRLTFATASVDVGSTQNKEIDLAGNDTIGKCQGPTGVVIDEAHDRAYVNCWITRKLGIVDLDGQALQQTVEAAPAPGDATAQSVQRGKRFYFTGRGRWSAAVGNGAKGGEGWSACSSCHPDGYTDNVTWSFGAGPRQTVSQDGSFSHGAGAQKQRIFNLTGIFDEHHDFERNTREVSGGLGAITTAPTLADCNQLDKETPVDLKPGGVAIGGLQRPLKELADDPTVALCGHRDWDDIDGFVRTIRPAQAARTVSTQAVARGRQLFIDGGCAKCHGGAGWTVSRRSFTPSSTTNSVLAQTPFTRPGFFPTTWMYDDGAQQRTVLSAQPVIAIEDATGPAEPTAVAIAQAACVLRNVGTFGLPGDPAGTDALEQRFAAGAFVRAQGRAGYNVPSLYGLALGAPYLHHGQAPTLQELFTDARWGFHTNAANANFSVVLAEPGKLDDLVGFLRSIDAATEELAIPTDPASGGSFDACP
jgi:YVTN family beta-propeller protein